MSYIDELFRKYAKILTHNGDIVDSRLQMIYEEFKQALTEALEKQREISCIAINDEGWHTYAECRTLILNTKLEEK